jgi:hypothetical protein
MRRRSDTATIEFQHPFGGDSVKLTRQIQTAIRQASGVPEPPLTLLTGWWSTGLTNNFSLVFAGQPSQELVLKYRGVIGKFFDTTFHLIPSRGFTKMMIFGVPCIRKNGIITLPHILLHELSHNTPIVGSCIVDSPTWSREALTNPSLEKSHCSFILIDPTGRKVQQIDRARRFAMFGAPVTICSATITQPYQQCDRCFLLNHDTQDCTKPAEYKRCGIYGCTSHVTSEHAFKCPNKGQHSTLKCDCPPRCFNCARNKLTKLDHYTADLGCPLKKRMRTPTPECLTSILNRQPTVAPPPSTHMPPPEGG